MWSNIAPTASGSTAVAVVVVVVVVWSDVADIASIVEAVGEVAAGTSAIAPPTTRPATARAPAVMAVVRVEMIMVSPFLHE